MQKGTRYGERGICVVLGIDPSDPVILSDKVTIVSTEREVSVLARIHQYLLLSSGSRERFWIFLFFLQIYASEGFWGTKYKK